MHKKHSDNNMVYAKYWYWTKCILICFVYMSNLGHRNHLDYVCFWIILERQNHQISERLPFFISGMQDKNCSEYFCEVLNEINDTAMFILCLFVKKNTHNMSKVFKFMRHPSQIIQTTKTKEKWFLRNL